MEVIVNDNNFEKEVIERSKTIPVVVDFWNTWCAPCLMLAPILQKIAVKYHDKFVLAKAKTDNNRKNAVKYDIVSIPHIKLFKDGKVVGEFVGMQPEIIVRRWFEKNIE